MDYSVHSLRLFELTDHPFRRGGTTVVHSSSALCNVAHPLEHTKGQLKKGMKTTEGCERSQHIWHWKTCGSLSVEHSQFARQQLTSEQEDKEVINTDRIPKDTSEIPPNFATDSSRTSPRTCRSAVGNHTLQNVRRLSRAHLTAVRNFSLLSRVALRTFLHKNTSYTTRFDLLGITEYRIGCPIPIQEGEGMLVP